jgi:TonB family protein
MYSITLRVSFVFLAIVLSTLVVCAQSSELPVPVVTARPPYPALAVAQEISGTVFVDVRVDSDGRVAEANVVMGPEMLGVLAKAAARGWRFKPMTPKSGTYTIRLTFIFHDKSYVAPIKQPDFTSPYQLEIPYPVLEIINREI